MLLNVNFFPLPELPVSYGLKELQEAYSIGQIERVKPEHCEGVSVSHQKVEVFRIFDGKQYNI